MKKVFLFHWNKTGAGVSGQQGTAGPASSHQQAHALPTPPSPLRPSVPHSSSLPPFLPLSLHTAEHHRYYIIITSLTRPYPRLEEEEKEAEVEEEEEEEKACGRVGAGWSWVGASSTLPPPIMITQHGPRHPPQQEERRSKTSKMRPRCEGRHHLVCCCISSGI